MTNITATFDTGLARYLEETKRFPMLTAERERELAYAWRDGRDQKALRALVGSHLRLAIKIARGFSGYGLPIADLIAEGNVGLMQAAEKFDPDRGFRFATYAQWWVRASIQEHILHNWSLVKMGTTGAQKKLFFNLRRMKSRMEELETGDLSPETVAAIAETLGVAETEVVEMNRRLSGGDSSLDATLTGDGESTWLDLLADDRQSHGEALAEQDELALRREMLKSAMGELNERERAIFVERRLVEDPVTLEELSQRFSVSRERVRQIENRAFEKVQKAVVRAARTIRQQAANSNLAIAAA